jgi:hypothetical protein
MEFAGGSAANEMWDMRRTKPIPLDRGFWLVRNEAIPIPARFQNLRNEATSNRDRRILRNEPNAYHLKNSGAGCHEYRDCQTVTIKAALRIDLTRQATV